MTDLWDENPMRAVHGRSRVDEAYEAVEELKRWKQACHRAIARFEAAEREAVTVRAENEKLRERDEDLRAHITVWATQGQVRDAEMASLRRALAYYADGRQYQYHRNLGRNYPVVAEDRGRRAREALATDDYELPV